MSDRTSDGKGKSLVPFLSPEARRQNQLCLERPTAQRSLPAAPDDTLAEYTFPQLDELSEGIALDDIRCNGDALSPEVATKIITEQTIIHSRAIATLKRQLPNQRDMLAKDIEVAVEKFTIDDYPWESCLRLRMWGHWERERSLVTRAEYSTPHWMLKGTCCVGVEVLRRLGSSANGSKPTLKDCRTQFVADLTDRLGPTFPLTTIVPARQGERREIEMSAWAADKTRFIDGLENWAGVFAKGSAGPWVDGKRIAQQHYAKLAEMAVTRPTNESELQVAYQSVLEFADFQARFFQDVIMSK
jgi:hypothetical protein